MAELKRRVLALRGAATVAGVAVLAASMTQVVGTMANPAAVRTATIPASTANYFPTPLPDSISCADDENGLTGALVSWPSAGPEMSYRVQVWDGTILAQTAYTDQTSFRPDGLANLTYRVAVSTVNTTSGTNDDDRVVSTGSRSHDITLVTNRVTQCVAGSQALTPNQPWENDANWTPPPAPEPAEAQGEANSEAEAEAETGSPEPDSGAASPTGEEPTETAGAEPSSTSVPPSTTATSTTSPTTTDSTSTESASPADPLPDDSTTETRQEAALGDDPIAVGTFQVRLDLADGVPHVIVATGGTQVCTVAVPGATAIAESKGTVEVTGGDQTEVVDPATCTVT